MKTILQIAGAVMMLGMHLSAEPVDFTFQVPVKLVKVHTGDAEVLCKVFNAQGESIAGKWHRFDLNKDGQYTYSYDGTVTLSMAAHSGKDPRDGQRYECQLSLLYPWMSPPWQKPAVQPETIYLSPEPGTTFTPLVSGTIPQPRTLQRQMLNKSVKPLLSK